MNIFPSRSRKSSWILLCNKTWVIDMRILLVGVCSLVGIYSWAGGAGGGHRYYVKTVDEVNRLSLGPGDSVFFRGGRTFDGTVRIHSSGRQGHPVWIGSYGAGKATINGGDSS